MEKEIVFEKSKSTKRTRRVRFFEFLMKFVYFVKQKKPNLKILRKTSFDLPRRITTRLRFSDLIFILVINWSGESRICNKY